MLNIFLYKYNYGDKSVLIWVCIAKYYNES